MKEKLNYKDLILGITFLIFIAFLNYVQSGINSLNLQTKQINYNTNKIHLYNDSLSREQIKVLEDIGVDSASTFKDALFPDGTSIFKWSCQNDLEFDKTHNPEMYKKCMDAGY